MCSGRVMPGTGCVSITGLLMAFGHTQMMYEVVAMYSLVVTLVTFYAELAA